MGAGERITPVPNPWLPGRARGLAAVRLFCFPYSGAGASLFYAWRGEFPAAIEVCPVQLPGRETRLSEPPFRRMGDLIPALSNALETFLDRPFALFGHSLGALIGFELARHLRREQRPTPRRLFVSAHRAPHLAGGSGLVHLAPDPELTRKLREMNGTPAEVLQNAELREVLFPILRADFELSETYAHEADEPLDCPISAFGGLADAQVGPESLQGWRQHTRAGFESRLFPGDHFFLTRNRRSLVDVLARRLEQ